MGLTVHCESTVSRYTLRSHLKMLLQCEYSSVQIGSIHLKDMVECTAEMHKSYIHTVVTFLSVHSALLVSLLTVSLLLVLTVLQCIRYSWKPQFAFLPTLPGKKSTARSAAGPTSNYRYRLWLCFVGDRATIQLGFFSHEMDRHETLL